MCEECVEAKKWRAASQSYAGDESGIRTCNQGFGGAAHVRQQQEGLRTNINQAVEPQSARPDYSSVQQRLSSELNVKTICRTEMMASARVR